MLKKLLRTVLTVTGAVVGYGVFMLTKFLVSFAGHEEWVSFSGIQEIFVSLLFAIIFGLLFFRLTPAFTKQGNKVAKNIESDLQTMSTNDIVLGTIGLIAGLIVAFLISQIYIGIKVPYVDVILNVITYLLLGYLGIVIATRKGKDIRNSWIAARKISPVGGGKNGRQKISASTSLKKSSKPFVTQARSPFTFHEIIFFI